MRYPLRFPELDLKKVSDATARQLRHHGVLEAFIEICEAGLDAFGLEIGARAHLPPRPLLWASDGGQPLVRLLPDNHPTWRMWGDGLRRWFAAYMDEGDRRVIGMLRSRIYGGPFIKAIPRGSDDPHLIAACVAMLHGDADSVVVYADSVVATANTSRNGNIEVFPDGIVYGNRYKKLDGRIAWEHMNIGLPDRRVPQALLQVCQSVLFIQDEMLDTLIGMMYLALTPRTPPKSKEAEVLKVTLAKMIPMLRESASSFSVYDAPLGRDLPQPVNPRNPYRKFYNTKLLAGSRAIPDLLVHLPKFGAVTGLEVTVNMLELFNFYVTDNLVVSPAGFWELTKTPVIVNDQPNIIPLKSRKLRRWLSSLHDG